MKSSAVFAIGQSRQEAQELADDGFYHDSKASADEILRVKPPETDSHYWGLLHVYKVNRPSGEADAR